MLTRRSVSPARLATLAAAALLYTFLLTRGSLNLFGAEQFGLTFNSMLDHLLNGAWDVDPAVIGAEAFVRGGRTYAYFGPLPAVLRLPLLLVPDWQSFHVERLSCLAAIVTGVTAQFAALDAVLATSPHRAKLEPPLLVLCLLSGAPMLLTWRGALIYHEAILWAWAMAMAFVAAALPVARGPRPTSTGRLCVLAACAGLCLLTRVSTGTALCAATGLLLLLDHVHHRGSHWWRALPRAPLWVAAGLLAAFVVLIGLTNYGRWGNPLMTADLSRQIFIAQHFPDRVPRLHRHGLFEWQRGDIGLLYYFFPVWSAGLDHFTPLTPRLLDLYDAVELPASSLLLTHPAWCVLAGVGTVFLAQRRASSGEALLAAGLLLGPALMLTAWYLAFRYRVEFEPPLFALSCIALAGGAARLAPEFLRRVVLALWLLCALQVAGAIHAGQAYALQPFGQPTSDAALSLRCLLSPNSCSGGE